MEEPTNQHPAGERIGIAIVGDGRRAAAYRDLVERSPRTVRVDVARLGARWDIAGALSSGADVRFVIALPARAALEVALETAASGRSVLVEAPLPLDTAEVPPFASRIQVAHGWVTLRRGWMERVIAQGANHVEIDIDGLPEEPGGDMDEVIVHALALLRRLIPDAEPRSAVLEGEATFTAGFRSRSGVSVRLRARNSGQRLQVRAHGPQLSAVWSWQPDEETRELRGGAHDMRRIGSAGGVERALSQLIDPEHHGGDDLGDAVEVLDLARRTLALLPRRLVPGARMFRQALGRGERHPDDPLAPLGLRGRLEAGPDVSCLDIPHLPEPLEVWSFRAGDKPVVFLTLEPSQVDSALGWFEGVHVERRERRVAVGAQDEWVDRRDLGQPRVELYISRDKALARRALELQATVDPSRTARELGELMGYPACCVEAFASLDDRSNNTRNRYATAARTPPGRWAWELNNFFLMLLPFFPCRYDCDAARVRAERALAELGRAHPDARAALQQLLSRPVLYFAHQEMLIFDGNVRRDRVEYGRVVVPEGAPPAFRRLASMLAAADGVELKQRALHLFRAGRRWASLERTDPLLGLLADFSLG